MSDELLATFNELLREGNVASDEETLLRPQDSRWLMKYSTAR
jgi:hypothetical protein